MSRLGSPALTEEGSVYVGELVKEPGFGGSMLEVVQVRGVPCLRHRAPF